MALEEDKNRGRQAKQLLEDPIFREAVDTVEKYLDAKILGCDPDNEKQTQRVVLAKQIMKGVIRTIETVIANGAVAEIKMSELDVSKVSAFKR